MPDYIFPVKLGDRVVGTATPLDDGTLSVHITDDEVYRMTVDGYSNDFSIDNKENNNHG